MKSYLAPFIATENTKNTNSLFMYRFMFIYVQMYHIYIPLLNVVFRIRLMYIFG